MVYCVETICFYYGEYIQNDMMYPVKSLLPFTSYSNIYRIIRFLGEYLGDGYSKRVARTINKMPQFLCAILTSKPNNQKLPRFYVLF